MTGTITAKMVADLRAATNAGMSDCKKVLEETGGNMDDAIKLLRERGAVKAAKRADRTAAEGIVGKAVSADHKSAALVELNCETDFVARNEEFQRLASEYAAVALAAKATTLDALLAAKLASGLTVKDSVNELLSKMGEKIEVSRVGYLEGDVVSVYIHPPGKIGVLVAGKGTGLSGAALESANSILRDVGMHAAAFSPRFLDVKDVDEATLATEREIAANIARNEGKPEPMIPKIVEGRLKKFYQEACLVLQAFAKDESSSVSKWVAEEGKKKGFGLEVSGFVRIQVGAGSKDGASN